MHSRIIMLEYLMRGLAISLLVPDTFKQDNFVTDGNPPSPRGLTFSPRPEFRLTALPTSINVTGGRQKINMSWTATDFTDDSPDIELLSVTVNDPSIDIEKTVRGASYGTADKLFTIKARNNSNADLIYTIMYRATNELGKSTLATTKVSVRAPSNL